MEKEWRSSLDGTIYQIFKLKQDTEQEGFHEDKFFVVRAGLIVVRDLRRSEAREYYEKYK